ncbi:MAG: VOC family protein [Clostridia bacterium]|jgi:catechol 2,3-dioxygenase-like lactoylglutathione lyase family enzyme
MPGSSSYTIEHAGVGTADPELLAAWYARVLGFREFFRTSSVPPVIFMEDEAGQKLEVFPRKPGDPAPAPGPRTGMHLAIVVSDFEAAIADLEAKGVTFTGEAFGIFSAGRARFFADPEGNLLHIVHRPHLPWQGRNL